MNYQSIKQKVLDEIKKRIKGCEGRKCYRNKTNCFPLAYLASDDNTTYICCGASDVNSRSVEQDEFRSCVVSETTDSCFDLDKLDILDQTNVFTRALSEHERIFQARVMRKPEVSNE